MRTYLGGFPAHIEHVNTVRPPTHDSCLGSSETGATFQLAMVVWGCIYKTAGQWKARKKEPRPVLKINRREDRTVSKA